MALKPGLEFIPDAPFSPSMPRGDARSSWTLAFNLAERFWQSAAKERAISQPFRMLAKKTLKKLAELKQQIEQA